MRHQWPDDFHSYMEVGMETSDIKWRKSWPHSSLAWGSEDIHGSYRFQGLINNFFPEHPQPRGINLRLKKQWKQSGSDTKTSFPSSPHPQDNLCLDHSRGKVNRRQNGLQHHTSKPLTLTSPSWQALCLPMMMTFSLEISRCLPFPPLSTGAFIILKCEKFLQLKSAQERNQSDLRSAHVR